MSNTSRRNLIKMIGGVAGAGVATALVLRPEPVVAVSVVPASKLRELPWPYKPVDPDAAAQRAFESFKKADCMYGSLDAILGSVAEQLGEPYSDFPFMFAKYGSGGINGWGTIC
jgi:hypothetical protein